MPNDKPSTEIGSDTASREPDRSRRQVLAAAGATGETRDEAPFQMDGGPELVVADGRVVVVSRTGVQAFGGQ